MVPLLAHYGKVVKKALLTWTFYFSGWGAERNYRSEEQLF